MRSALEDAFAATFADPAWPEAAACAGLLFRSLLGAAHREAALKALCSRRPWED